MRYKPVPCFQQPALLRRLSWVLCALMVATAAPAAHAQWKWRDKSGQVNASDRPPPRDVPEKDILARPVPEVRRIATEPAPAAETPATPPAAHKDETPEKTVSFVFVDKPWKSVLDWFALESGLVFYSTSGGMPTPSSVRLT